MAIVDPPSSLLPFQYLNKPQHAVNVQQGSYHSCDITLLGEFIKRKAILQKIIEEDGQGLRTAERGEPDLSGAGNGPSHPSRKNLCLFVIPGPKIKLLTSTAQDVNDTY